VQPRSPTEVTHIGLSRRAVRKLRAISLMYHDIVDEQHPDSSGFAGRGPARYKLDPRLFDQHLTGIAASTETPSSVLSLLDGQPARSCRLLMTFDDGGASAVDTGKALARRGWIGHFFIPTDFIGKPGFVDAAGINELARPGHVIGTHSCSHTVPMSRLCDEDLVGEWRRSIAVLSDITGSPIVVGSVPGGYSSHRVIRTAAAAGLRALFTSEPRASARLHEGCIVLGRYAIQVNTPAETAAALARGDLLPRLGQLGSWKAKGALKTVLGDSYRRLRSAALERS
jgi:peptidoglycan/xylan/chitin deacetylase (PgdA/CDA1 family)